MRFILLLGFSVIAGGCRRHAETQKAPVGSRSAEAGSLPRIGLTVSDSAHAWCAEFVADSSAPRLELGQHMTIVFAGSATIATLSASLGQAKHGECPAAFAQPRWIDYVAYRVDLLDSVPPGTEIPMVALIVAGDASWARGDDGMSRADLDRDGQLEEVRRCTADEGEHWTVWSIEPGGRRIRRWHEYYDWGGFTDPTCRAGENGLDESIPGAP